MDVGAQACYGEEVGTPHKETEAEEGAEQEMNVDWVPFWIVFPGLFGLWFIVEIVPLMSWRANNVRKAIRYRWNHGYWCEHKRRTGMIVVAPGDEWCLTAELEPAWTQWVATFYDPSIERRWCERCGHDQVRNHRTYRVQG